MSRSEQPPPPPTPIPKNSIQEPSEMVATGMDQDCSMVSRNFIYEFFKLKCLGSITFLTRLDRYPGL